jgi:hypothetical protein
VNRQINVASFRWLFAETLVIVLGVLIALGLNDYWNKRQERLLAIDYVVRMQADLEYDIWFVQTRYQPRLARKREALDFIQPIVSGQVAVPEDLVSFFQAVSLGGIMSGSAQTWYADITFNDLRATGNMRVIQNSEIRDLIANYYGRMEAVFEGMTFRHTDYVSFVHTAIPAELRENLDLAALESFGVDFALSRIMSDDFRSLVNEEYNYMLYVSRLTIEEEATTLLQSLQAYQEELEGF